MSQYTIINKHDPREDTTPLSTRSPQVTNTASPRMSTGGKATLGYSALIARQTYQIGVGEIEAMGNEQMAREIRNTVSQIGYASLVIATGGKAMIPLAVSGAVSGIQRTLEVRRDNTMTQIQNRLIGNRIRVGVGRD